MAADAAVQGAGVNGNNLESVASIARRALGGEAVVITCRLTAGRPSIAASAGIAAAELEAIWPTLDRQTRDQIVAAEELGARGWETYSDRLDHDRYALHHCAALCWEERCLGSIHVLDSNPDGEIDIGLLEAFAAHSAIALGHRGLREHAVRLAEQLHHREVFDNLTLSADTTAELIPRIDDALRIAFGAVATGIMVLSEDHTALQLVGGSFGASAQATSSYQVKLGDLRSNAARVFGLQRPYISNHAEGDPGILQDYVQEFGIDRLISMPLVVAGKPTGVLHIANKQDDFAISDLERCLQLVSRVAVAVESTRMLMRLRMQQRLENVLSDMAVAIASNKAGQEFLPESFERFRLVTEASVIALVPDESEPILTSDDAVGGDVVAAMVEEARAVDRELSRLSLPQHAGDPGSAVFHAPVVLGSRRLGTLSVLRSRGQAFTPQELRGLSRMGRLITLAWASEHYQQQRVSLARMQERQRIADDLHDDVSQLLFAAQMQLDQVLEDRGTDPRLVGSLTQTRDLLTRADSTIRFEIAQLSRPRTEEGLVDRLVDVVDGVEQEFGLPVHLEISGDPPAPSGGTFPAAGETMLRVARESLVNAAKHAGPCRVGVYLERGNGKWMRLRVVDDGLGPREPSDDGHHGMTSLKRSARKHGGSLRVRRNPGGGTTVAVELPI